MKIRERKRGESKRGGGGGGGGAETQGHLCLPRPPKADRRGSRDMRVEDAAAVCRQFFIFFERFLVAANINFVRPLRNRSSFFPNSLEKVRAKNILCSISGLLEIKIFIKMLKGKKE